MIFCWLLTKQIEWKANVTEGKMYFAANPFLLACLFLSLCFELVKKWNFANLKSESRTDFIKLKRIVMMMSMMTMWSRNFNKRFCEKHYVFSKALEKVLVTAKMLKNGRVKRKVFFLWKCFYIYYILSTSFHIFWKSRVDPLCNSGRDCIQKLLDKMFGFEKIRIDRKNDTQLVCLFLTFIFWYDMIRLQYLELSMHNNMLKWTSVMFRFVQCSWQLLQK